MLHNDNNKIIIEEEDEAILGKDDVNDPDQSWVDFEEMEVEEARARRRDPRSFSTIFCFK